MEKKNRLRGPNFTKSDSILLCDVINNFKHIIECKKTDGVNLMEKHKAWQEVVKIYNSSTTGSQRTLESLQQNYKNLKKKIKKSASDAKMNIPVLELVHSVEEFGTSSDGWEKISHNMGVSTETCQEVLANLKKEADRKDAILKKNVMGTGGGPAPNYDPDPLLGKVKVLVGPAIDGLYTIYDGDSCLMASQPAAEPVEAINMQTDTQEDNQHGEKNTTLQLTNVTQHGIFYK
ncbi:uncharacterized protein LOC113491828 [Trichoplusia ni]|uniref:Regulatory protein zeste n=1 Tax=Trichoplusia ni TaxID=7111 RepID=A0A7E5V963_TRINI|nr:uncharacterized protein LOC113491828 [Trichoplusia ni]